MKQTIKKIKSILGISVKMKTVMIPRRKSSSNIDKKNRKISSNESESFTISLTEHNRKEIRNTFENINIMISPNIIDCGKKKNCFL
jgi:hypothetical protein